MNCSKYVQEESTYSHNNACAATKVTGYAVRKKLWHFLLVFLIIAIEFDPNIFSMSDSFKRKIIISLMGLFGFHGAFNLFCRSMEYSKLFIFYFVYLIWLLVSCFWAINPNGSFVATFGVILPVLFMFSIYRHSKIEIVLDSFVKVSFLIALLSWMAVIINPNTALHAESFFRLKGIMYHSQRLALLCGISLIIIYTKRERVGKLIRIDFIMAVVLAITIIATKTRSFTACAFLLLIVIFIQKKFLLRSYIILLLTILAYLLINYKELFEILLVRGNRDLYELTGRTQLWESSLDFIRHRPWLGYGFGAFKEGYIRIFSFQTSHAHNMWIHTTYETGLIGTLLLNVFLFGYLIKIIRNYHLFYSKDIFYILLYVILVSLTGVVMGYLISPLYMLVILILLMWDKMHFGEKNAKNQHNYWVL